MQRQFDRLLEMLLLKQLDRKDAAKVRAYRLHVKARLYRFNYVRLEGYDIAGWADGLIGNAVADDARGAKRGAGQNI